MEKFSVIIPTMWKSEYLNEMLIRYSESDYVGEIILIDNAPELNKSIDISKVKHLKQKQNIFVNPAWNLGVYVSSFKNITIANDDILFDVEHYYQMLNLAIEKMPLEKLGFIGMHSENYKLEKHEENITIKNYNNAENKGGWGCIFSFNKSNWRWIPPEIKIWFGDNWLHMVARPILELTGFKIETKMSTTSDLEIVNDVKQQDKIEWNKIYRILACAGMISA